MSPSSRSAWRVSKPTYLIQETLIGDGNGCHMERKQSIGFFSWGGALTTRVKGHARNG